MEDRFYNALWRNLNELRYAISMRNCLNELRTAAPETNWGFFSYCSIALFNDMFAHEIKVLDRHKDAASFWYIRNCESKIVDQMMDKHGISISEIENLADKLVKIRDKTHFHIDKKGVLDSKRIWLDADIKGDEINRIIDKVFLILNDVFIEKYHGEFGQPVHDGTDAGPIIKACEAAGIEI